MAEEKEQTEQKEEEKKKKKSKSKLLIIPVAIIILAAAGYVFYAWKFAPSHSGEAVKKVEKGSAGAILTLEPFVFNLSGDYARFVKIALAIEVKDEKVLEETKKIIPSIRDKALSFISSKPLEAFMDIQKREEMKKDIREQLKGLFKEEKDIKHVYITDIIIQ